MRNAAARSNLLVPEVREVMDIRQASDYLGVSPDTLYKYASDGFVPAFKLGNRWRFKRSRLDEWMDRQSDMQAEVDPLSGPLCKRRFRFQPSTVLRDRRVFATRVSCSLIPDP